MNTDSSDACINVAVVGCGYWGPNLIRSFASLPDARLHTICDLDVPKLETFRVRYPSAELEPSFERVLANRRIDAVVIATAVPSHFRLASMALQAGKHVYVEKPMTLSVSDSASLVRLARDCGRILMVGHLLEYHPAVEYMKQYIESGELGDLRYAYTQRLNLGKIRTDESALWSLAPHDISVIGYLTGASPSKVCATGQSYLQDGVEDVVFVSLQYETSFAAHIHVSWLDPHKTRRITLVGSKRMIVFDDTEANEKVRVYDKGVDITTAQFLPDVDAMRIRLGDILIPRISEAEPLRLECAHFIESIRSGREPRSSGIDGLRVVEVLAAADQSLKTGGTPVNMDSAAV